jgi:phosphoribosylformylglycinamidine synthase
MVWHDDYSTPPVDFIILPGGFSYGDYLRSGAMAAKSNIMQHVIAEAKRGVNIMGICNGFQILTEAGLLPGTLMRNCGLKFIGRDVQVKVRSNQSIFTRACKSGQVMKLPIAHQDGNYFASEDTISNLYDNDMITLQYVDNDNPNGSIHNIAGITNKEKNVFGLMPHPERACDELTGGLDGEYIFKSFKG